VITNWRRCRGEEIEAQLSWETTQRLILDDRQGLDITLVVIIYLATPQVHPGSKEISTRENPQESPVTPVPNPELILRRGRSFQGQTSKSGTKSNPLSHSKKSIAENTESSSSKIVSEKAL
jgi:hypothetical protein